METSSAGLQAGRTELSSRSSQPESCSTELTAAVFVSLKYHYFELISAVWRAASITHHQRIERTR